MMSFGYPSPAPLKPAPTSQPTYSLNQQKEKPVSPSEFYDYARVRDDDFTETIKAVWHDFSISKGVIEEPSLNLIKQPVFNNSDYEVSSSPVNLPFSGVTGISDSNPTQIKAFPRIRKPETDTNSTIGSTFMFFGQKISVRYDRLLAISTTSSVSEDSISGFWKSFSYSNSNLLVDQLMDYRDRLGLCDWGYFQLVKATASHIKKENNWGADQLTWALMIRSGFDVRLAFNQSSTTVLFPSENIIYEKNFVLIGQKRFYLDREMKGTLLAASPNPYPDTNGNIDLRFYKSLNFSGKSIIKKFLVDWDNKRYEFVFRINPDVNRFYNEYPKTDPAIFFGAPVTSSFKDDLLRQLYPLLSKINKSGAAAFIQQFVQQQVKYYFETNKQVVPARFAEEVVASGSADDRGKSVLFSWMIRILLNLPVAGVQFPGYYSTAICFDGPMDGSSYLWKKSKYIFADPTFQNIPLGILVPEFEGLPARITDFPNNGSPANNEARIWHLAHEMGALRGGASHDIIFDKHGNALITGYFAGKKSNTPFVACFTEAKTLQWIRKFEGNVNAASFAITKVNDDEIYIAGTFKGKLGMDGQTIQTGPETKRLFLAQFNQNGELIWMKHVPIDTLKTDQPLVYSVKSDRTGNNISFQWTNEDPRNITTGFTSVSENGLMLMGYGNFNSGDKPKSITGMDSRSHLARSLNERRKVKIHPRFDAISDLMKLLQKPGTEFNGLQIQSMLTRKTAAYATDFPSMYNSFGRVARIKNENGILTINTSDYKSLLFNNLRIENGARFISTVCSNDDILISVISGFQNIGNPVNLDVNSILIDCSSGNLILDYDSDHTIKTISPEPQL